MKNEASTRESNININRSEKSIDNTGTLHHYCPVINKERYPEKHQENREQKDPGANPKTIHTLSTHGGCFSRGSNYTMDGC